MGRPVPDRRPGAGRLSPMIDGWSPGIGDPTPLGWITTGVYLLTAWLCVRASAVATIGHDPGSTRRRRFWLVLAAVMAALAINKQLDLQSLFTAVARRMARDEGWYNARRSLQRAFIIAVTLASGLALGLMLFHLRHATNWMRLAGLGLTFLAGFVVMRAASFHHMDVLLGSEWAGIYANHVLELGSIAIIALGAAGDRRRENKSTCRQL